MYKILCKGEEGEGEDGKDRNEFVKIAFFKDRKIVYTKKKSNLQIKDTDHMEVPCILTKQKLNFWPKFPSRANQKNFTPQEIKFYFITYWSHGESSCPHETKNRVSYVICVENDAKVDARCHTLKIDLRNLKCTKIDAKENDEKIGMNLLKSPFFDDRKNRLHKEKI